MCREFLKNCIYRELKKRLKTTDNQFKGNFTHQVHSRNWNICFRICFFFAFFLVKNPLKMRNVGSCETEGILFSQPFLLRNCCNKLDRYIIATKLFFFSNSLDFRKKFIWAHPCHSSLNRLKTYVLLCFTAFYFYYHTLSILNMFSKFQRVYNE